MLRTDSLKYHFLELIGICGEFPSEQLFRFFHSPSYAQKVITELKNEKLIRTHYNDSLRGYRLTKQGKSLLLNNNPERFHAYLTGNSETNRIRSEPVRRKRLHLLCETYMTLLHSDINIFPDTKPCLNSDDYSRQTHFPLFYSSKELKEIGSITTKFKNSRSMGILLTEYCIYVVYNTGNSVLKWEYRTEVRLNAFLQHYFKNQYYHGPPEIHAIMLGQDMNTSLRLMISTGGYKQSLFKLDNSFTHFHYLPNSTEGETVLKILSDPVLKQNLDLLLLSDLKRKNMDLPLEHDACSLENLPVLLAYDFDMHRINRFNTGLNVYGVEGVLVCFDYQIPILKQYVSTSAHFSSIDLVKFRKAFFNDPKMD